MDASNVFDDHVDNGCTIIQVTSEDVILVFLANFWQVPIYIVYHLLTESMVQLDFCVQKNAISLLAAIDKPYKALKTAEYLS
jgi:hypothetical protein